MGWTKSYRTVKLGVGFEKTLDIGIKGYDTQLEAENALIATNPGHREQYIIVPVLTFDNEIDN